MEDNSVLLRSGRCQMTVQAEDITGHQTRCLNNRHTSASFSSQANFLKFQAMMLQEISQGKHNKVRETIAYHNLLLSRPLIWLSRLHPYLHSHDLASQL